MYFETNTDWLSLLKNEFYYPKLVLEKYNFDNGIEVYSNNSYYVEFYAEYYDEKYINLFLKTIRKI